VECDDWEEDRCVMVWDIQHEQLVYRIHPDDLHLQYGPISTALRERAATGEVAEAGLPYINGEFHCPVSEWREFLGCSQLHTSLFLLILAEALADEGL